MPSYLDPVFTTAGKKFGERPSVFDYGAIGDGVTDDGPAFNRGILDVGQSGAGTLWVPGGYIFAIGTHVNIPSGINNFTLAGDGTSSLLLRTGDFSGSYTGVIHIEPTCQYITIRDLAVDGNVFTSVGKQYGGSTTAPQFGNNATNLQLVGNTSIFVDGLTSNILIENVTVQHTGGYSILLYAINGFIQNVAIRSCLFWNNRPHLFGTTLGDLTYGSWTGGVFGAGDASGSGTSTCVIDNLVIDKCSFLRITGNCSWTHCNGVFGYHTNVRMTNNYYQDCGLDGVLFQVVSGGVRSHNTMRRMGYICSDDTSAAVPKYLASKNATAIDSGGIVSGVTTTYNSITSCYGGSCDMDGCQDEVVANNMFKVPVVGDLEYTEDGISGWTANVSYGCNMGNSNAIDTVGRNCTINSNTFINLGAGAIRLGGANNTKVNGNNIQHPVGAAYAPILFFNLSSTLKAVNCSVSGNLINLDPGSLSAAILESTAYTGVNWLGTDKNWVAGNHLFGNCTEFTKDVTSGSVTGLLINTTAGATSADNFSGGLLVLDASIPTLTLSGTVGSGYIGYLFNSSAPLGAAGTTNTSFQSPGCYIYTDGRITALGSLDLAGITAPAVSAGNHAKIYVDTATHLLMASVNGAAAVNLLAGGTGGSAAGGAGAIQYSDGAGTFLASTGLFFTSVASVNVLTLTGTGASGIISPQFNGNVSGLSGSAKTFQNSDGTWSADHLGNLVFQTATATTVFNSLSDLAGSPTTTAAFQTSTGTFVIFGSGDGQFHTLKSNTVFNSLADLAGSPSTTAAVQTSTGTFKIFGSGDATFQTVKVTTVFNSLADLAGSPSTTAAVQTSTGTFKIFGSGDALFQTVKATTVFNSLADTAGSPSTTAAIQTSTGTFVIYGSGDSQFATVATNSFSLVGFASAPSVSAAGRAKLFYNTTNGALMASYSTGAYTGLTSTIFNAVAGSTNLEFQGTNFSVRGDGHIASNGWIDLGVHSAITPLAAHAYIWFDSGSNLLMASVNGAAGVNLLGGGGGSAAGATGSIQYSNGSGTFLSSTGIVYTSVAGVNVLTLTGSGASGLNAPVVAANAGSTNVEFQGSNFSVTGQGKVATNGWLDFGLHATVSQAANHSFVWYDSGNGTLNFTVGNNPASFFVHPAGPIAPVFNSNGTTSAATFQNANSTFITDGLGNLSITKQLGCGQIQFTQETAPGLSPAGKTFIYMDSSTHLLMASVNGGTAVNLLAGSSAAIGTNTQVAYNNAGVETGDANLTYDVGLAVLRTFTFQSQYTAGAFGGNDAFTTLAGEAHITGNGDVFGQSGNFNTVNGTANSSIINGVKGQSTFSGNSGVFGLSSNSAGFGLTARNTGGGLALWSDGRSLLKYGSNADSTGQPVGTWAGVIYNATNAINLNGLLVKTNWAASSSTILECGNDFVGGAFTSLFKVDGGGTVTVPGVISVATVNAGTISASGSISSTWLISSSGGLAGFEAFDRAGGSGQTTLYRNSGSNALFDSTYSDMIRWGNLGGVAQVRFEYPAFSSVTGSTHAFDAGSGAAIIYGNGNIACQDMASNTAHIGGYTLTTSAGVLFIQGVALVLAGAGINSPSNAVGGNALGIWNGSGYIYLTQSGGALLWNGGNSGAIFSAFNATGTGGGNTFQNANSSFNVDNSGNLSVTNQIACSVMHASTDIVVGSTNGTSATGGSGATICNSASAVSIAAFDNAGNCHMGSAGFFNSSDVRLKENISPMGPDALKTVLGLNPVHFNWIGNGQAGAGFLAHEVRDIIPSVVEGFGGYLSLSTQGIVPYLVASIQSLSRELDDIKRRIN